MKQPQIPFPANPDDYNSLQRKRENQTSWRFSKKLQRLWASQDYRRKIMKNMDTGEPKIPIEDAVTIFTAIWVNLRKTLTHPHRKTSTHSHLSHAAWVLRCFLEIDAAVVPHRSIKARVCKSYAVKKGISKEQARLDFLDGLEKVHQAALRVYFKSRDTALTDLQESLLVIKRLEGIDSGFANDDDIGFIDQYIGELNTLIIS